MMKFWLAQWRYLTVPCKRVCPTLAVRDNKPVTPRPIRLVKGVKELLIRTAPRQQGGAGSCPQKTLPAPFPEPGKAGYQRRRPAAHLYPRDLISRAAVPRQIQGHPLLRCLEQVVAEPARVVRMVQYPAA